MSGPLSASFLYCGVSPVVTEAVIRNLVRTVFGSANERELRRLQPCVDAVNAFEPELEALAGDDVRRRARELRQRVGKGEPLDDLLPEAFALVREAARRSVSMRLFDVQLIGGMVLHQGKIAEMKTGEARPSSPPCRAT